jgi:hypothetical protein
VSPNPDKVGYQPGMLLVLDIGNGQVNLYLTGHVYDNYQPPSGGGDIEEHPYPTEFGTDVCFGINISSPDRMATIANLFGLDHFDQNAFSNALYGCATWYRYTEEYGEQQAGSISWSYKTTYDWGDGSYLIFGGDKLDFNTGNTNETFTLKLKIHNDKVNCELVWPAITSDASGQWSVPNQVPCITFTAS